MYPSGEGLGLRGVGCSFVRFPQHRRRLRSNRQGMDVEAIVEKERGVVVHPGARALAAVRGDPVAEKGPFHIAIAHADIGGEDAVLLLGFNEGQPAPHGGVGLLENALVTILEIDLPGHGHTDATPGGTAAGDVGAGCRVGQIPVSNLAIPPIVEPLAVQRGRLEIGHAHFHGRARVAAIAEAFAIRTVDHIAAQGQAAIGPVCGGVDSVHQVVGTCKLRGRGVIGRYPVSRYILGAGRTFEAFDMDPAKGVVIETGLKGLGRRAVENIFIVLVVGLERTVAQDLIAVFETQYRARLPPFGEAIFHPAGEILPHIDQPGTIA